MPDFPPVIDLSTFTAADGFIIQGIYAEKAGYSVASAGDVNGDGFDDIIVGGNFGTDTTGWAGLAHVVFGSAGGFGTVDLANLGNAGFVIEGDAFQDSAGRSVSSAGDVNGDGFDDLIVGAPYGDDGGNGAGEAYVVFGGSGLAGATFDLASLGSAGFVIQGDITGDRAGWTVASAGDVNGDGVDDVIVSAPRGDDGGNSAGEAYVVFGSTAGLAGTTIDLTDLGTAGFVIQGDTAGDKAGWGVSSAGDVNGDGITDLIVGAPNGDDSDSNAGEAYVIFGSTSGLAGATIDLTDLGSAGFVIQGATAKDYAGISVSSAGDVDGDGFDDLIIGATGGDGGGSNSGEIYVVFGSAGLLLGATIDLENLGTAGFMIQGDRAGDRAGWSVSSAGDVNGDGFDDIIVGAPLGDDGGIDAGEGYVLFGRASGLGGTVIDLKAVLDVPGFVIRGDYANDRAGYSVASAGDINGDGFDDVIVGAPRGDDGGPYAGEAYVVYGRAPTTAVTRIGSAADQAIRGGAFDDILSGLEGDDTLSGGDGNDLLDGGLGADAMAGGGGDDIYVVDDAGDTVAEAAGEGTDLVRSTVSFTLGANLENLRFLGSDAIDGAGNGENNALTGNEAANVLTGNGGDDRLLGGGGGDTLDGGDGNDVLAGQGGGDVMTGGLGDDTYYIDNAGDQAIETDGAGIDIARAGIDYALADNLDNLILLGGARAGTGNGLDNTLFGSGGADTLSSLDGADTLRGREGRDTINGGDGADLIDGGVGKDTLTGGGGRDVFQFRDGDFGATRALADVITDFSHANSERIQLNLVDADTTLSGNQAFAWLGNGAFTGVAGQLHYVQVAGNTYVEGDTNGDGAADLIIALTGAVALVAGDFVL